MDYCSLSSATKHSYSVWMIRKLRSIWIIFNSVFFYDIIKVNQLLLHLISSFLRIISSLFNMHKFVCDPLISLYYDCYQTILLTFSANILWASLLHIYCDFTINLSSFENCSWFSLSLSTLKLFFFSKYSISFLSWFASWQFS